MPSTVNCIMGSVALKTITAMAFSSFSSVDPYDKDKRNRRATVGVLNNSIILAQGLPIVYSDVLYLDRRQPSCWRSSYVEQTRRP